MDLKQEGGFVYLGGMVTDGRSKVEVCRRTRESLEESRRRQNGHRDIQKYLCGMHACVTFRRWH